ncbi:hypothetical protein G6O67_004860 [Ophiocordyceps sinensis]|uniref:C2H2-type domain-containing protein n=2 Tax=Ophiocordyceps sinensis TaxID=72228 RepID=A0A8H4PQE0_9HYPO|nr:hypothetical protein G6O67_004860 [Ophiocordyceps sinensis]
MATPSHKQGRRTLAPYKWRLPLPEPSFRYADFAECQFPPPDLFVGPGLPPRLGAETSVLEDVSQPGLTDGETPVLEDVSPGLTDGETPVLEDFAECQFPPPGLFVGPGLPPLLGADTSVLENVSQPGLTDDDLSVAEWLLHRLHKGKALSTTSLDAPSSAGSTLSPVQTDQSMSLASRLGYSSRCISPLAVDDQGAAAVAKFEAPFAFASPPPAAANAYSCNWSGCRNPGFSSRDALAWHVKAEHLIVCPVPGCPEPSFPSPRMLLSHIAVAHPDVGKDRVKDWQLSPQTPSSAEGPREPPAPAPSDGKGKGKAPQTEAENRRVGATTCSVAATKRKYQDQLRSVVEKKARKGGGTPRTADSPTDIVRARASKLVDTASFALAFEHAVLPFLAELLPAWSGPRHVISVTRGRSAQMRHICIMTSVGMSRPRKITLASHVGDLLPDKYRPDVSFVFSVGEVSRIVWARGLDRHRPDDICHPRNPHHFQRMCMGDSVGIRGSGRVSDSTATLGPCLEVSGGSYWLVNFHPFLEAYQSLATVSVEHPSPQDRERCRSEGHQVLPEEGSFEIGTVEVTSGLNLKTTRISHDPYWDECAKDHPLVVTDWALVAAGTSGRDANVLRRFPAETEPHRKAPLVRSVSGGAGGCSGGVVPGAAVVSSGRTSGYQHGQVCEVPAYVSGEENGTGKATREWFVEELPPPWGDQEAWIRGGIGVEGDSGAAVVDAETNSLVGQLWGRNKYWGSGPRLTYFTPAADILDDIQEKCGLQTRPQLPQHRDDWDCYPWYPTCRRCYDLSIYLDSRRSSRASLQSMFMYADSVDHDLTSVEAASELATPRDLHRGTGVEEVGASFHGVPSPTDARLGLSTPMIPSIVGVLKSPYPQSLELDDALDTPPSFGDSSAKQSRPSLDLVFPSLVAEHPSKRPRTAR